MKEALSLSELIKLPTFGINKVRKITTEAVAQAIMLEYNFIRGGRVLRVKLNREHPLFDEKALTQFIELPLPKDDEEIQAFVEQVKNGDYLDHGILDSDAFKEDFLPFYLNVLNKKLSYGTDPLISHTTRGALGDTIYFSTVKDGERKNHTARWTRLDWRKDFNKVVVIPRPSFKTYREFGEILAELLEIPRARFLIKQDPTAVYGSIEVFIDPNDLIYFGSITVSIPDAGENPAVYSLDQVVSPEEPGEGGEEPGTGENPSDGGNEPDGESGNPVETQGGEPLETQTGAPLEKEGE